MGNEPRDAFKVVLVDVALKQTPLNPVLEALVSKADAELVEGVGSTGHVLWAGEVEKADKDSEVFNPLRKLDEARIKDAYSKN